MQVNRDSLYKAVQRMRKHFTQAQIDPWYSMIHLSRGLGQHSEQVELRVAAAGVEWVEWIESEFEKRETIREGATAFDARVGCEPLYQALKDRFSDKSSTIVELQIRAGGIQLARPNEGRDYQKVFLPAATPYLQCTIDEETKIIMGPRDLHDLLAQVAYARSNDHTRPHLCGVELTYSEGTLRATATDGHRLASATYNPQSFLNTWEIVLPGASVEALLAALRASHSTTIEILTGGKFLIVEGDDFAVSVAAEDNVRFPPWEQVCPRETADTLAELPDGVRKAVAELGKLNANRLKFTWLQDAVVLQALDSGGVDELPSPVDDSITIPTLNTCKGDGRYAYFELRYVVEAVAALPKGGAVSVLFGYTDLDPIAIRAGGALHVIMPVRM